MLKTKKKCILFIVICTAIISVSYILKNHYAYPAYRFEYVHGDVYCLQFVAATSFYRRGGEKEDGGKAIPCNAVVYA